MAWYALVYIADLAVVFLSTLPFCTTQDNGTGRKELLITSWWNVHAVQRARILNKAAFSTKPTFISFLWTQVNAQQTALSVQCGRAKQQIATAVPALLCETPQCRRTSSYLFILFHITVNVSVRNLTKDSVLRAREKGNKYFCIITYKMEKWVFNTDWNLF